MARFSEPLTEGSRRNADCGGERVLRDGVLLAQPQPGTDDELADVASAQANMTEDRAGGVEQCSRETEVRVALIARRVAPRPAAPRERQDDGLEHGDGTCAQATQAIEARGAVN